MTSSGQIRGAHEIFGLAVAGIAHQQALALQVTGDAVNDGVRQLCEFIAGRRLDPNNGSD